MDRAIAHILEVVVVDMARPKAQAGQARVDIVEPVVMIGHMQVTDIFRAVSVRR